MQIFYCKSTEIIFDKLIHLIPYGQHITDKGEFVLDKTAIEQIISAFSKQHNDMVIDYEHQTLTGQEAPAAGWIKELISAESGIWAKVEWTDKARKYIENKEYRYISPVFMVNKKNKRVQKLINAALTNAPAIDGMEPLVNKGETTHNAMEELMPFHMTEEEIMNFKQLLGLGDKEDVTGSQVLEAVKKLKEQAQPVQVINKAVAHALGVPEDASQSEVVGTIMAMKQSARGVDDLAVKLAALQDTMQKKEADELVALALRSGKITPAQIDWANQYAQSDPAGFKVFAAKAGVVVSFEKVADEPKPAGQEGIDETQMAVNKMLGITPEKFKQFNTIQEV